MFANCCISSYANLPHSFGRCTHLVVIVITAWNCCITISCDASCFSTRHLSLRFRKCQMKIVPRFQDLKWQKWWPTMIQMNCHLLCWCQRVWTILAGCCFKIWRNRPTWCFHLSAFQLLLLCWPLVQKGKPSHRWNSPSKSFPPIYSLPHFYF